MQIPDVARQRHIGRFQARQLATVFISLMLVGGIGPNAPLSAGADVGVGYFIA